MVGWLNERGLKGSFALMGSSDAEAWANGTGARYKRYQDQGHSVLYHGPSAGIPNTIRDGGVYQGLSHYNDSDKYSQIDAVAKCFVKAGLKSTGFCNFDDGKLTPRIMELFGEKFSYSVLFDNHSGINNLDTSPLKLARCITDRSGMVESVKELIDSAIGKNCLVILGGHMNLTGSGKSGYSTEDEIIAVLDYVEKMVKSHKMIAMNCEDAVDEFKKENVFAMF